MLGLDDTAATGLLAAHSNFPATVTSGQVWIGLGFPKLKVLGDLFASCEHDFRRGLGVHGHYGSDPDVYGANS